MGVIPNDVWVSGAAKPKKYFSNFHQPMVDIPNLVGPQLASFKWLIEKGLNEVIDEIDIIKDYSGKKFEFKFVDFKLGEPKYDEYHAKVNKLSYEAPLKATVELKNKALGTVKDQEIFLADLPMMTNHGTFVISGIERVIVPQLARSFGVFFTSEEIKGKRCFGAKIIPSRGAWIELETDVDGAIYVRIDRKRKFSVTSLLRVFGAGSDGAILELFKHNPNGKATIESSLLKDHAKTADESYI
jgi:DNA-directed RNA polymerase subunit beta